MKKQTIITTLGWMAIHAGITSAGGRFHRRLEGRTRVMNQEALKEFHKENYQDIESDLRGGADDTTLSNGSENGVKRVDNVKHEIPEGVEGERTRAELLIKEYLKGTYNGTLKELHVELQELDPDDTFEIFPRPGSEEEPLMLNDSDEGNSTAKGQGEPVDLQRPGVDVQDPSANEKDFEPNATVVETAPMDEVDIEGEPWPEHGPISSSSNGSQPPAFMPGQISENHEMLYFALWYAALVLCCIVPSFVVCRRKRVREEHRLRILRAGTTDSATPNATTTTNNNTNPAACITNVPGWKEKIEGQLQAEWSESSMRITKKCFLPASEAKRRRASHGSLTSAESGSRRSIFSRFSTASQTKDTSIGSSTAVEQLDITSQPIMEDDDDEEPTTDDVERGEHPVPLLTAETLHALDDPTDSQFPKRAPSVISNQSSLSGYVVQIPSHHPKTKVAFRNGGPRVVPSSCAICLDSYEVDDTIVWSTSTKCIHAFHETCITMWCLRKIEEHPTNCDKVLCPCCRQPFVEVDCKVEEPSNNAVDAALLAPSLSTSLSIFQDPRTTTASTSSDAATAARPPTGVEI